MLKSIMKRKYVLLALICVLFISCGGGGTDNVINNDPGEIPLQVLPSSELISVFMTISKDLELIELEGGRPWKASTPLRATPSVTLKPI